MEQYYVARFEMTSAVINVSPLDAIIHKYMTDDLDGDYVTARGQLPFAQINGVLCSSFPLMQDWEDAFPIVHVNALRNKQVKEEWVTPNTTDKTIEKVPAPREKWSKKQIEVNEKTGKTPYIGRKVEHISWGTSAKGGVSILNEYQPIFVPFIYYAGITTNLKLLKSLCERIYFIGKGRSKGQGQVKEITLIESGTCNGIVDSQGNPIRAIPVDSNIKVAANSIISDATYQPAYWDPVNRTACYTPDFARNWKLAEIEKELM